jgi:hypothetical protein
VCGGGIFAGYAGGSPARTSYTHSGTTICAEIVKLVPGEGRRRCTGIKSVPDKGVGRVVVSAGRGVGFFKKKKSLIESVEYGQPTCDQKRKLDESIPSKKLNDAIMKNIKFYFILFYF